MTKAQEHRLPPWLRKKRTSAALRALKCSLRGHGLHTVCEEARCPNIAECFRRGTATFLIMGSVCTRRCAFCAIPRGQPLQLDPAEPRRVAEQVRALALRHAVVTSVTRDDLPDGGAGHFAATIGAVRAHSPGTTIEVLTPDFEGREEDVALVAAAAPDVFNHNLETVERITPLVRDKASYSRSLEVLAVARRHLPDGLIKSGLIVGLGEGDAEISTALRDLARAGCDAVTIGQYLAPSKRAAPVARYVAPATFEGYVRMGKDAGLRMVEAGPLVRSSYLADRLLQSALGSSIESAQSSSTRR